MRLLFDQNISHRVLSLIKADFPEARHVKEFELQFASDREIWKFAKETNFEIVTFDADFYDLATLFGHPPKIIWLRLGNTSSQNLAKILSKHKNEIMKFTQDEQFKEIACLEIS